MKISKADFDYYTGMLRKDEDYKDTQYTSRINPSKILMYYEGSRNIDPKYNEMMEDDLNRISLNKIFPATQTVVSTLYPNNPGFIARPRRSKSDIISKLAQTSLNYYFDEMNALEENQKAILNAWLF